MGRMMGRRAVIFGLVLAILLAFFLINAPSLSQLGYTWY
jgi:hypothetical protein